MLREIHLHGALADKYGKLHRMDVESPAEAVHALISQHKDFRRDLLDGAWVVSLGDAPLTKDQLSLHSNPKTPIHIEPAPAVAGFETFAFILVGALLVSSVALAFLFAPPKLKSDPNDRERKTGNTGVFDGPINVSEQGHPIPIILGEVITGSVVASQGITTADTLDEEANVILSPGVPGSPYTNLGYNNLGIPYQYGQIFNTTPTTTISNDDTTVNAKARIIDILGEGQIHGLVDGAKSVYLDETVLMNPDGSWNHQGVRVVQRVGTADQTYIPGFAQQENSRSVETEVTVAGGPIVETITDEDVNVARVTVRFNALFKQNSKTGDLDNTSVVIKIELQKNGGGYVTKFQHQFTGNTDSPYQKSFEINLPAGTGPWDIRVTRVTPDSTDLQVQDVLIFDLLTEVIEVKLRHPNTALIGIEFDAKQFGPNLPVRGYHVRGLICEVPTNYNPATGVYTGTWDGTFKWEYTNNPAWQFRTLALSKRFGLGHRLTTAQINKWSLYTISQYNDQLVPGPDGNERRFTCNTVLTTVKQAQAWLAELASCMRAAVYWSSGAIQLAQDAPSDPVMLVTKSNAVERDEGPFDYSSASLADMYSVVLVGWNDPDDMYREHFELVENADLRKIIGWRRKEFHAFGATSRGQAIRAARWFLDDQTLDAEQCQYESGLDHAFFGPGDIVALQDEQFTTNRMGGRVRSGSTTTTINLDANAVLDPGESYILKVMLPNGTVASSPVTDPAGTYSSLHLSSALAAVPLTGAVWSLQSQSVAPRQWRARTIKEADDGYEINLTLHDPSKYARVERNIQTRVTPFMDLPTGAIGMPGVLTVTEYTAGFGDTATQKARLAWVASTDKRVIAYETAYRQVNASNWVTISEAAAEVFAICDTVKTGSMGFRVRAIDSLGRKSPWRMVVQDMAGKPAIPGNVLEFGAYPNGRQMTFKWKPVTFNGTIDYEIRYCPTGVWEAGTKLVDGTGNTATINWVQNITETSIFAIKAKTRATGLLSVNARYANAYRADLSNRNYLNEEDFAADSWLGYSYHMYEDAAGMILGTSGEPWRPQFGDYKQQIDLGREYYAQSICRTTLAKITQASPTWAASEQTWAEAGPLQWKTITVPEDRGFDTTRISIDTIPDDLIEGWSLDNTATGANGAVLSLSGASFASSTVKQHFQNHLVIDSGEFALGTVALGSTFTVMLNVARLSGWAPGNVIEVFGADGWLRLEIDDTEIRVHGSDGNVVTGAWSFPADALTGRYTLAIVQTLTERRLMLYNEPTPDQIDPATTLGYEPWVYIATGAYTPIGSMSHILIGSAFEDQWIYDDTTWDDPLADETWDYLEATVVGVDKAAISNVTAVTTLHDDDTFLVHARWRGPAGFTDYREFVDGDYNFQRAWIWTQVNVGIDGQGLGLDQLILENVKITTDVPDVDDKFEYVMTAAQTDIPFQKTFYDPPICQVSWLTGATTAFAEVVATYEDRVTVKLRSIASPATLVAGTVVVYAKGKGP